MYETINLKAQYNSLISSSAEYVTLSPDESDLPTRLDKAEPNSKSEKYHDLQHQQRVNESTTFTMATRRIFSRLKGRLDPSRTFIRDVSYYCFAFVTWIPAIAFFNTHVLDVATVDGPSMSPYLNTSFDSSASRDKCLIKKWNAKEGLERGMIITIRFLPTLPTPRIKLTD